MLSLRCSRTAIRSFRTTARIFQQTVQGEPTENTPESAPVDAAATSESSTPKIPQSTQKSWKEMYANSDAPGFSNMIQSDIFKDVKRSSQQDIPPLAINRLFERHFKVSETYNPNYFSLSKIKRETKDKYERQRVDPFKASGINPTHLYLMPEILSKFISSTGQILPREMTGCSSKNQYLLAKAIKTSRACGLLPTTHRSDVHMPTRIL
ncbi:uncharacterized protein J8A68_005754 [[Candida] subhashii]|uniref:Ribosomal protein S18 n=1 Tax=[Candida] subhashii TaxID=561895 RepID=A0A8J5QC15_9ASCO|nr:uncharacterized protein J8A68_005754 [[Candida] subhashii]KAG7660792.1 hypothetical protein J8A68_005754 [[Candida] subhashii]